MSLPRTPEQTFQQECIVLMTYVGIMDAKGALLGGDTFCVNWEHYHQVHAQLARTRLAYQACFITPEWKPANDNAEQA